LPQLAGTSVLRKQVDQRAHRLSPARQFKREINEAIRRGKAGEATFCAAENGCTVGTANAVAENTSGVTDNVRDRHYCAGCDGGCMHQAMGCKQCLQRQSGMAKL
jgi:hypothetical protein